MLKESLIREPATSQINYSQEATSVLADPRNRRGLVKRFTLECPDLDAFPSLEERNAAVVDYVTELRYQRNLRHGNFYLCTDEEAIGVVAQYMTKCLSARQLAERWMRKQDPKFEEFLRDILRLGPNAGQHEIASNALREITQGTRETFPAYVNRTKKWLTILYLEEGCEGKDLARPLKHITTRFVAGIRDEDVALFQRNTLLSWVNEVRLNKVSFEEMLVALESQYNALKADSVSMRNLFTSGEPQPSRIHLAEQNDDDEDYTTIGCIDVFGIMVPWETCVYGVTGSHSRNEKDIVCFACGEKGHMARKCQKARNRLLSTAPADSAIGRLRKVTEPDGRGGLRFGSHGVNPQDVRRASKKFRSAQMDKGAAIVRQSMLHMGDDHDKQQAF